MEGCYYIKFRGKKVLRTRISLKIIYSMSKESVIVFVSSLMGISKATSKITRMRDETHYRLTGTPDMMTDCTKEIFLSNPENIQKFIELLVNKLG